jgi:hypothetical protein
MIFYEAVKKEKGKKKEKKEKKEEKKNIVNVQSVVCGIFDHRESKGYSTDCTCCDLRGSYNYNPMESKGAQGSPREPTGAQREPEGLPESPRDHQEA